MERLNLQYFAEDGEAQETAQETAKETAQGSEKKGEAKYTDADVDKIINAKFAEWAEKKQKEVDEAKRLEKMNAQERAEHERDELQKKLDELMRKETLSNMRDTARGMLRESQINAPDELLAMLVSEDAEQTKKTIEAFSTLYQEAVKNAVAEALKGNPPKAGATNTKTKEDILSIKDRAERQKAISENIELFKGV